MDFHSLTRKELQSLCKLNKIPANITNVAMADALQSLDIVEGIEKFIMVTQSETANMDESKETVEKISSPNVPKTRCRTTNRKKVKTTEPENLRPTDNRTTRRTAKKLAGGVDESKTDVLETPALSSARRKALATSSCRNVNSQLNDCELEAKEDEKSVVTKSRRKVATTSTTVKKEESTATTVQKTYSTRRSTRHTEKKSGESRVRKESEKAVEINSMLDVASHEVLTVEGLVNAGNPDAEVENICNAFEELVVVVEDDVNISEEKEDSNLKPETDEISNLNEEGVFEEKVNDVKSCENGDLEMENLESVVMVMEEHPDGIIDDNSHTESGDNFLNNHLGDNSHTESDNSHTESGDNFLKDLGPEGMFCDVSEMNTEAPSELNSNSSPGDENIEDIKEVLENIDEETLDAIPTIDTDEVEDLNPELITDMAVAVSSEVRDGFEGSFITENIQLSPNPSTLFDLIAHPTPIIKSVSKKECEQEANANVTAVKIDSLLNEVNVTFQEILPVEVVEETMDAGNPDAKMEHVCNSFDEFSNACESVEIEEKKLELVTEEEHTERFLDDDNAETESGLSTMLRDMILGSNENPKPSLKLDEENTNEGSEGKILENAENPSESMNLTFQEVLPVEVPVDTMDAGNPDAKMEHVCISFDENQHKREENVDDLKLESDEFSNQCEDGDLEEKQKVGGNFDVKPESDEIVDFQEEKLELVMESGSSILVNDMVLDNNENPKDSLNRDNVNSLNPNEEITKDEGSESMILENTESKNSDIFSPAHEEDDIKQGSENMVEEVTLAEADTVEETDQLCQNQSSMNKMSIVSDGKENSAVVFGNKTTKEKYENKSIRQLKKQVKALTLKSINANNNLDAATKKVLEVAARPPLQALCENQLVGGETKN